MTDEQIQEEENYNHIRDNAEKEWLVFMGSTPEPEKGWLLQPLLYSGYIAGYCNGYKSAQSSDDKLREIARTIEGKLLEKEAYGGYKGDVDNLEDVWFDYLKKELQ